MTSKAVTRARATPTETAGRVEAIAEQMRTGVWRRGESAVYLASEWGLAVATVEGLSAEASRVVAREVNDPEGLKTEVATVLRENLHRASRASEYKAVASLADVVTKIVGARAPERHEHAHVVASYEAMPVQDKAKWLRAKAAELLTEADRLENVVSVQADASTMTVR
jgi:hypothetical protein